MYNSFFGFKERPFQLVPNPAYLYLSRSHEEAMAHMVYAISQGDGFVEITGEVGTGKTTLCRAVLENLDQHTEAAYIFNPKLDSFQLLRAINDEFGIDSSGNTIKELIDTLNAFLMTKKREGNKVVLIIDEAQNLSEDVLEQLRLLSNLETTTSKLIQIILVGQPELGEMLDSNELRQLGQRITLSCYLTPLSYKESREYIDHRIQVASQKPEVRFTRGALRAIYRYSGGIPRLINIACDRALLTAYGLSRKKISGPIAKASIRELAARGDAKRFGLPSRKRLPSSVGVILGVFVAVLYLASLFVIIHQSVDTKINALIEMKAFERPMITQKVDPVKRPPDVSPAIAAEIPEKSAPRFEQDVSATNAEKPSEKKNQEPSLPAVSDLGDVLEKVSRRSSRALAMKAVIDLWPGNSENGPLPLDMEDDQVFFKVAARQNGLLVQRVQGDWDPLLNLNLPAVLEFYLQGGGLPRYLTLAKINDEGVILLGGMAEGGIQVDKDQLTSYWSRVAYLAWKDFLNLPEVLSPQSSGDAVLTLKLFMQEIGYKDIEITPIYDERTMKVVKQIQQKYGIRTDGIVGPMTKIALYNEKASLGIPHLVEE
jgi:general secretion pathway protein A